MKTQIYMENTQAYTYKTTQVIEDPSQTQSVIDSLWSRLLELLTFNFLENEHISNETSHLFRLEKYSDSPFSCVFFFKDEPKWRITESFYQEGGIQYFSLTWKYYEKDETFDLTSRNRIWSYFLSEGRNS